jgi:RES domain-containing protein
VAAPVGINNSKLVVWRLEREIHLPTWSHGIGAFNTGGRWNPKGRHAIYTSLDPATAILEIAVHVGFAALDAMDRWLLEIEILDPASVIAIHPNSIPNPRWLTSGSPTLAQQKHGAGLLDSHGIVAIPSAVSTKSWNVVIDPNLAAGKFKEVSRVKFGLDPRLAPSP